MNTKIALEGINFFAYHGFYDDEQVMGQNYIIDVEVEIKSFDNIEDDISDTINYESIFHICKEIMSEKERLLEKVTLKIINSIKEESSLVRHVKVVLKKCQPQLGGSVKYAVITMSS